MIYNISQIGDNIILTNYDIPIDSPFFLAVLKVPCYSGKDGQSKNAILNSTGCNSYYNLSFTGVEEVSENLLVGDIYYPNIGTWTADIYYQDNDTNTDLINATFIDSLNLQVTYNG